MLRTNDIARMTVKNDRKMQTYAWFHLYCIAAKLIEIYMYVTFHKLRARCSF